MKILAIKSIPLSKKTYKSWKGINVTFLSRNREPDDAIDFNYDVILNLGNSNLNLDGSIVWNEKTIVDILKSPSATREHLDEFLAPLPLEGDPFWIKGRGYRGRNTSFLERYSGETYGGDKDIQKHIEGQEYKILTVNNKIVQIHQRLGGNESREYQWIAMSDTPKRVKKIVREASASLPSERTVLSWDVIDDGDNAYILEGNTCPGVNEFSAYRIYKQIGKYYDEDFDPEARAGITNPSGSEEPSDSETEHQTFVSTRFGGAAL